MYDFVLFVQIIAINKDLLVPLIFPLLIWLPVTWLYGAC